MISTNEIVRAMQNFQTQTGTRPNIIIVPMDHSVRNELRLALTIGPDTMLETVFGMKVLFSQQAQNIAVAYAQGI